MDRMCYGLSRPSFNPQPRHLLIAQPQARHLTSHLPSLENENNNTTHPRSCYGDKTRSITEHSAWTAARAPQGRAHGNAHLLRLGSGGQRLPWREAASEQGRCGSCWGSPAFQKALQAIVLINTLLFPLWRLSPCLLCVNRVFQ